MISKIDFYENLITLNLQKLNLIDSKSQSHELMVNKKGIN